MWLVPDSHHVHHGAVSLKHRHSRPAPTNGKFMTKCRAPPTESENVKICKHQPTSLFTRSILFSHDKIFQANTLVGCQAPKQHSISLAFTRNNATMSRRSSAAPSPVRSVGANGPPKSLTPGRFVLERVLGGADGLNQLRINKCYSWVPSPATLVWSGLSLMNPWMIMLGRRVDERLV